MRTFIYYSIATLVSLALHGGLLWLVMSTWHTEPEPPRLKRPEFVKATLVELKAKAPKKVEKGRKADPVKKIDLAAQRKKAQAEKKRIEKAKADKKQQLAKQKAERDKAARKKAQKARQAKEAAAKAKAAKQKAEKQALEKKRQAEQAAIEKALQEEEMMLAQQAEAQVVNSYKAVIMDRIAQKWSRPPSARRGMQCELVIQLVPTGKIITVNIVKGSGNAAFDRSAEQAVHAVDQIPELQGMDIGVFERNFRTIHLLFNPEDRRL